MRPIVTDGVVWSVGPSVCHDRESCKSGWTDREEVSDVDSDNRQISDWSIVKHLLLADWCHQWLDVDCVRRRSAATSFLSLGDRCAYSRSFCVLLDVVTVNVFSSVNKMMLTSLCEYFSAIVLNGRVLHGSSFHSALVHGDWRTRTFHEVV